MTKNIGAADRVIRTIVAVVIGVLLVTGVVTGLTAVILGILAVVLLLTVLVSVCPLYLAFNISTKAKNDSK